MVINGENFHALQLLTLVQARSIDCIYIDPPYNTGDTDWKYNNRYIDKNDLVPTHQMALDDPVLGRRP